METWLQAAAVGASIASALATVAIAVFGVRQLRLIAQQNVTLTEQNQLHGNRERKWQTLQACNRFDQDPILEASTARIWMQSKGGLDYSDMKPVQRDVINLLNALDAIAIGVAQKLYIEEIARDNLEAWFHKACREFLTEERAAAIGLDRRHFAHLIELSTRWQRVAPHYQDT